MAEPTIVCPNCKIEINLTEYLAALPIEATGRDLEQRRGAEREATTAARPGYR